MSDQVWWYATRAAGLMTWSTAVAAVIVGLLLSTRVVKSRTGPWLLDLHRFLGGISVLFLIAHMGTLYFDSFVDFGPRELFIPGESTWNPEAAAWGIIGAFTLVLVEITSLLRKWISTTVWRLFHMLSIVTVGAGSYHAFLGGSDVDNPLTWLIAGAGSAIVVMLVGVRLRRASNLDHTTADRSSREALLREMRQRLEGLPVPESTIQPELDLVDAPSLPRRAPTPAAGASPFDEAPLLPGQVDIPTVGSVPGPPPAPPAPATAPSPADAFAAVPLADETPDLGNWVAAEPEGPFGRAPVNPFGGPPPAPAAAPSESGFSFANRPVEDPFRRGDDTPPPLPNRRAQEPSGEPPAAEPFTPTADAPFPPSPFGDPAPGIPASEPHETPSPSTAPAAPPAFDPVSPFGSETPAQAAPANPFKPAEPTPQALSVEVPAAAPAAAPTPVAMASTPAPPPLPEMAIDPTTGEPDQAAYQAWLVDWLAFAEKYGEETPDDPNRI